MSENVVCMNGQLVPENEAKLSVNDRGLTHGFGFFETMRAHNGLAFRLSDHLARLRNACKFRGIAFPPRDEMVAEKIKEMSEKMNLPAARIRLSVTAGDGAGPWFRPSDPNWFMTMVKLVLPPDQFYKEGVDVVTVESSDYGKGVKQPGKSLSYERHLFTRQKAVAQKTFEFIYTSTAGEMFEGAGANIFAVIRRRLITPPIGTGILPGIARLVTMKLAKEKLRYQLEEMPIHKMELQNAEEAFLTNSIIGVMPIKSINGQAIFKEVPGPMTRKLVGNYRAAIVDECGDF